MNQGKENIVKQGIARVNINILRISGLKLKGMGEFNSDDQSLRRNEVALIVNKSVQNSVLVCNLRNDRVILVHFQSKPFNITVSKVHVSTTNAEETKGDQFYEDLHDNL